LPPLGAAAHAPSSLTRSTSTSQHGARRMIPIISRMFSGPPLRLRRVETLDRSPLPLGPHCDRYYFSIQPAPRPCDVAGAHIGVRNDASSRARARDSKKQSPPSPAPLSAQGPIQRPGEVVERTKERKNERRSGEPAPNPNHGTATSTLTFKPKEETERGV
jgi:hypothetical protein